MDSDKERTNPRLFAAVPIVGASAIDLSHFVEALRPLAKNVQWTPLLNYHITLAFLGEWHRDKVPQAVSAIADGALATPAFDITLARLDAFPTRTEPRVLWAGISTGDEELRALQTRVASELEHVGYVSDDRPYVPHVTLGRLPTGADQGDLGRIIATTSDPGTQILARQVWLFASSWNGPGSQPEYEKIALVDLA